MSDDTARTAQPGNRFVSDLWRLAFILLLTFVVRVWVVSHAVVTFAIVSGLFVMRLQLEDPPMDREHPDHRMTRLKVIEKAEHPPGYYVSVLLVSYPVRAIMGGTTCDSMVMSTQVASVLAALLLTFPMYYLGRMLFDRQTAFVATLLFQTLPVWTAITSDGLSDGLFLLVAVNTLWLGARTFREPTFARFLLAGIGAGFAYLVRPEGVLLIGASGCTAGTCVVLRRWSWQPGVMRISGLVAGGLLIGLPYVLLIGKLTNKPTGEGIFKKVIGEPVKPSWQESNVSARPAPTTTIFAVWWSEFQNQGQSKVLWAAKQVPLQILKTLHYCLPFVALVGFYVLRRKIWGDTRLLVSGDSTGDLSCSFADAVICGRIYFRAPHLADLAHLLLFCRGAVAHLRRMGCEDRLYRPVLFASSHLGGSSVLFAVRLAAGRFQEVTCQPRRPSSSWGLAGAALPARRGCFRHLRLGGVLHQSQYESRAR